MGTGKINITPARPQSVPTGSQNRPNPVPTGRQNSSIPVPTSRGDSPSVTSGWWKSTARPMPHLNRPTSSYFQTYTPYVPQVYSNHMQYGGVRWATAVKPSAGCSWKTHRKGLYWENSYTDAEDEGIFDSGCSRSMIGNMERLDDFQGVKVTFGGGEGRITGKGIIRTPTLDFENVYYVKELQHFNLFSISQICNKKKYPLSINLIERMLDHQLEICHGTMGNELTTAVQLIAFLKKQISDSKRPKVHEWVVNSPCYHNKELASPEQTATAEVVPKSVAGSSFLVASSTLLPFDVQVPQDYWYMCRSFMCSSQDSSRLDVAVKFIFQSSRYVVPTGRVVVPAGRYIVPAGKVIIIVSTGRLSLVPTGRVLSPGRVK
ncbi:hypothetical protein Tco_1455906 [Tanacetum coccineum]